MSTIDPQRCNALTTCTIWIHKLSLSCRREVAGHLSQRRATNRPILIYIIKYAKRGFRMIWIHAHPNQVKALGNLTNVKHMHLSIKKNMVSPARMTCRSQMRTIETSNVPLSMTAGLIIQKGKSTTSDSQQGVPQLASANRPYSNNFALLPLQPSSSHAQGGMPHVS